MKSAARLLAKLYPRAWRERYGVEFDALLDDTALTRSDLFDLITGALKMQIKSWNAAAIFAAIACAAVIAGAAVAMSASTRYSSTSVIRASGDQQQFLTPIQKALSRQSLTAIIDNQKLYAAERRRQPVDEVIEKMRRDIAIYRPSGDTSNAIAVQFRYSEAAAARSATRQLASAIAHEVGAVAPVHEIDSATPALDTRSTGMIAAAAFCGGAIAGLALLAIRRKASRQA